jgi:hypothetical protein
MVLNISFTSFVNEPAAGTLLNRQLLALALLKVWQSGAKFSCLTSIGVYRHDFIAPVSAQSPTAAAAVTRSPVGLNVHVASRASIRERTISLFSYSRN